MASFGAVTASLVGGSRPKSAGVFPSTNRKVVVARVSDKPHLNQCSYTQRRPQSSRQPRPPVSKRATSPRSQLHNGTNDLSRQVKSYVASRHNLIMQQVIQEEINEQRHVTLKAKRQLHEVHATIARREEELQRAQRHLQRIDKSSSISRQNDRKPQMDVVSSLKEEIAHQDAYKKRMRYLHERLKQQVRYLEASANYLTDRREAVRRERNLCRNRIQIESDKYRRMQQQLKDWQDKRAAFNGSALPIIESYRDELASRLVVTQQREDADRRRNDLLRFLGTRPSSGSGTELRTTAVKKNGVLPSCRMQRRESFKILMHDADKDNRETLFAVYEGQYERVVRETGEVNLSVVIDRFQSYRESTARLQEIENELRSDSVRLTREYQAHSAINSRLQVSGPVDMTEGRQRLRDQLEEALHGQELEKNRAQERLNAQLKAFVYLQQGVVHVVELLHCLDDQVGTMFTTQMIATARTVVGGSRLAGELLESVVPALKKLLHLVRDVGRCGLQRDWLNLPTIDYSVSQVVQLMAAFEDQKSGNNDQDADLTEDKLEEECQNDIVMRKSIKQHEQETLRQAETYLKQTSNARQLQSSMQSPHQADIAIVLACFREQRRIEKRKHWVETDNVLCLDESSIQFNVNELREGQSPRKRNAHLSPHR